MHSTAAEERRRGQALAHSWAPLLVCGVAVLFSGCFRRIPYFLFDTEEELPLTPVVARWFGELDGARYPELQDRSDSGVSVAEFRLRHEIGLFTEQHSRWGNEPGLPVLLFSDTDHPETYLGAEAAWFLVPEPPDGVDRVRAVLFRQFAEAPEAEDPVQLLVGLSSTFVGPWTICSPWQPADEGFLVAYGPQGIKLGLQRIAEAPQLWSVDHVEFLVSLTSMEEWWIEKGYGGCAIEGSLDTSGRYQPAGRGQVSEMAPGEGLR